MTQEPMVQDVTEKPAPAAPPTAAKPRLQWVDCAKGFGILLVVLGHVWHGLFEASIAPKPGINIFQVDLIYTFHMPLFFFLSGLFIERSAQKSAGKFTRDKLATIAWPYVVWTFIHWSSKKVMASQTTFQAPPFTSILLGLFYNPYDHLWFLYVLLLFSFLFLLLYRLRLGPWGILAVGLVLYAVQPFIEPWLGSIGIPVQLGILHRFLQSFVYLAAGALVSRLLIERLPDAPLAAFALAFIVGGGLLAGGVYAAGTFDEHGYYEKLATTVWNALPFAALGISAALAVAVPAARASWMGWVRQLGEYSLEIYLAHILATAGARIVLQKVLHVDNVAVHVVLGTAAGLLFPIALVLMARRLRMTWLFSLR